MPDQTPPIKLSARLAADTRSNSGNVAMARDEQETLSIGEFFAAISGHDGVFELVGGIVYVTTGGTEAHNVICSNVLTALVPAAKRTGARATSRLTGVRTAPDTVRYPDVVVDCSPPDAAAMTASRPVMIVEIASIAIPVVDYGTRLCEYQALDGVDTVMQIEVAFACVLVHRRQEDGSWTAERVEQFGVAIALPSLATSLTLDEIYDTLAVKPRPRLRRQQR
ncbi:Uma2 family endonuclease [Bradyrhizobium sp. WSM1743]|uniref:Uma2 family endonuclease n=1 Tax=Bradyrhizobium sp. WSM1743 TaxID=318996 RepID=UPI0018DC45BA|nr:Uma2 family endonuclease [Bradyrhizobium sp. WSM1743]